MATDPEIKAALREAVQRYDAARVAVFHGTIEKHGMSPASRQHIEPLIAAAVAAFLRALPPAWHMDKPRDVMAAAVERAAREAGDER